MMEALSKQIRLLQVTLTELHKMEAKSFEDASFSFNGRHFDLRFRLSKLRSEFVDLKKQLKCNEESIRYCKRKVKNLTRQCEQAEKLILKEVSNHSTKTYLNVANYPSCECLMSTIQWLYGYVAYLNGMAYAAQEIEQFTPLLTCLRHDLDSLEDKYVDYQGMEGMWEVVFELRGEMEKWKMEFQEFVVGLPPVSTVLDLHVENGKEKEFFENEKEKKFFENETENEFFNAL